MPSTGKRRRPIPTTNYFRRFVAGESSAETVRIMLAPKFWEFLESKYPKDEVEWLVPSLVRRLFDGGVKYPPGQSINEQINVAAENFPGAKQIMQDRARLQALSADVPEGEKFKFYRAWFKGGYVREETAERPSGEKKANKEDGTSEAQGLTVRD